MEEKWGACLEFLISIFPSAIPGYHCVLRLYSSGLLEKGMATHSSILAWKIPRTEEPGGLQSTGSRRVGHNWAQHSSSSVSRVGTGNLGPAFEWWRALGVTLPL